MALILPVVLLATGATVVQWRFPSAASAAPTQPDTVHTTPPDLSKGSGDPRSVQVGMYDYYYVGSRAGKAKVVAFEYVLPSGAPTGIAVYPGTVTDENGSLLDGNSWPPANASGSEAQEFLNRIWADLDEIASNPEGIRLLEVMGRASVLPATVFGNEFNDPVSPAETLRVNALIARADPNGESTTLSTQGRTTGVSLSGSPWDGEGVGNASNVITIADYVPGFYDKNGRLFAPRSATVLFHEMIHAMRGTLGFKPLDASRQQVKIDYPVATPGTEDVLRTPKYELFSTRAEELITHGGKIGLKETFGVKRTLFGVFDFGIKADPYAAKAVGIATKWAANDPTNPEVQRALAARLEIAKRPISELSFVKRSPISQPHRPSYDRPKGFARHSFKPASGHSWASLEAADYNNPDRSSRLVKDSPAPVACGAASPVEGCAISLRAATAAEVKAVEEFRSAAEEGKVFQVPAESEVVAGLSPEEIPVYARASVRSAASSYEAARAAGSDLSEVGFTSDLAESWKNPGKLFHPFGGATSVEGVAPARVSTALTEGWGVFNEALTPAMAAAWINSIAEAFSQDASDLTKATVILAPVPVVGQLLGIADAVERHDALSGVVNALALLATVSEMAGQPELAMLFGVVALVTTVVAQIADWASGKSEADREIEARNQAWHDTMKKNVIEKSIPELLSTAQKAFDRAQKQVLFGAHLTMETVSANAARTGHSTAIAAARTANARISADAEASVGSLRSGFINGVHQAVDAVFASLNEGTGSKEFTRAYMDKAVWPQWSSDHIFDYCPRDPNSTYESCRNPEKYIPRMQADFKERHVKPVVADTPKDLFTADDVKAAQDAVDTRVRQGKMFMPMSVSDTAPVAPAGFIPCADDGGECKGIEGRTGQVAFGAAGSYVTVPLPAEGIACKASSFPVNPNPRAHQSCFVPAQDSPVKGSDGSWLASVRVCAQEGATCEVSGTQLAAFGTGASWLVKPVTSTAVCSVGGFGGDPAPGKAKECRVLTGAPPSQAVNAGGPYQACAVEGERCHVTGAVRLALGAHINDEDRGWTYKTVKAADYPDGVPCTIAAFGKDPLPGETKSCYIANPPAPFAFCAGPDQTCAVPESGAYQAAYGGDGSWVVKTVPAGEFTCNDASFADVASLSGNDVQGGSRGYCYLSAKDHDLVLGADTGHERESVDADWAAHACARDGDECTVSGPAAFAYGVYEANQDKGAYLVRHFAPRDGETATLCSYSGFTTRDPQLNVAYCFLLNTPRLDFDTAQTDFTYRQTKRTDPGQSPPDSPAPTDPHPEHGADFTTGFEQGDAMPSWTDTVDQDKGGVSDVGGRYSVPGPVASPRTDETARTGTGSLKYSGSTRGGAAHPNAHAYLKLFDLSDKPIKVDGGKTLSYWIHPKTDDRWDNVDWPVNNGNCVALDLVFTDGSTLRDSAAVDQHGNRIHPAGQCQGLKPGQWNHVTVQLPDGLKDKEINRINVGYDQDRPGNADYSGYIDDITLS
ncbi:hypothetical protein QCN29_25905 [Streptomyces sp. HNM0663]|uniref:Uncharacterized protein n=1 Tax=Streptomyces chengmaiensis TaxID=3040919 RepID=A0ABT6HVS4_9ACTN|nr:hypothetical protein [Streptomyces chengmaiensis]MDH2392154.1 hypothetical protein [Streptomyces chengmaiensis]